MAGQETLLSEKRRRGPAPTGVGIMVGVRIQPDLLMAIDTWIEADGTGMTRPEAIRKMVEFVIEHGVAKESRD